jgi:GT2 family glycosyltransferase
MDNSIAIITVAYNSVRTIQDTLWAINSQQEVEVEHIIVDGGSTDGTLELIRKSDMHKLVLVSEPDKGIYDAMNKGIRLSTSSIVGFLNSDDVYFDQQVLHTIQQAFAQDPSIEIVYGDLVYVRENDLSKTVRNWKSRNYDARFFEDGYVPPHPSFFVKRSALIESGGFDQEFQLAADYELMFRLLKIDARLSLYLPRLLVRMRLGGKTNRSLANIVQGNREIIRVWSKHKQKIPLRFWFRRYLIKLGQYL